MAAVLPINLEDSDPTVPKVSKVTITFPGADSTVRKTHSLVGSGVSSGNISIGHSIDDVELRPFAVGGSVFSFREDGSTDQATERLFCLQRYVHFRLAFRKVSALMAMGSMVPAVSAAMEARWMRFALLACVVSPIYVVFSLMTYKKDFAVISGTRVEKMIVVMLVMQCIAINFSEWARPRLDYGFTVMHFSFIHNFTPLGAATMNNITGLAGVLLYIVLKLLRYTISDSLVDDVAAKELAISTKEYCVRTTAEADCIIGIAVPSLLFLFQTLVTMRRSRTMRLDMLHQEQLKAQQTQLNHERKTSEGMLRSMLPRQVIASLKRNEPVDPQLFDNVTVIFAEVCGFGELCAHLEPALVVEVLNVIYMEFDRLSDLLRVYKVETVSQVYMAVVGCPEPIKNHADVAAHFALACIKGLKGLSQQIKNIRERSDSQEAQNAQPIRTRVGLNSGRLRAGVVGLESPRYKLVGDTVNTASRMESTCEPGRVQVSASTLMQLSKNVFLVEDRGEIQVKGKSPMRTAFLNGYVNPSKATEVTILAFEQEDVQENEDLMRGSFMMQPGADFSELGKGANRYGGLGAKKAQSFTSSLPALSAAFKRDVFDGEFHSICSEPEIRSTTSFKRRSFSAMNSAKWATQGTAIGFNQFFLFVSPAYTAPDFVRKLENDESEYEEATLQSRMAFARNLTLLWLLVISSVSAFDYYAGLVNSDVERYSFALIGRVLGNHIVGIVYLLFLASPDLFRRYAKVISIAMLIAQGMALLISAMIIYNNESSIVALFGVYVTSYTVCTIYQRLCICLGAVIGFLLIEFFRCDWQSVQNESTTIVFLVTFFCFIACGIRLEEFMAHVAHYENRRLAARFEDIKIMKASGNELLISLLPAHVVSLVREGVSPIAENHTNVTIIFTDIKGFTAYSAGLSPQELMAFLNSMYSAFDEIILNWGLYKVEIIGDAYFIASGCPAEEPAWKADAAAMRAVEVALALLRTVPQVCTDNRVQMRVGLHTGSVVAGVVGKKGPRFHLFGPTVVYAEKMESHGEPGRVHISNQTYETLLQGGHDYDMEERISAIEGYEEPIKTWWVNKSNCKEAGILQRGLIVQRHRRNSHSRPDSPKSRPNLQHAGSMK